MAERQSDGKYAPSEGKTIYVGSLNTLGRINDELTRLYKRYWKGEISASDASSLASVLRVKKEVHETALLETQLEQTKIELRAFRVEALFWKLEMARTSSLTMWPISTRVNVPENDEPSLLDRTVDQSYWQSPLTTIPDEKRSIRR